MTDEKARLESIQREQKLMERMLKRLDDLREGRDVRRVGDYIIPWKKKPTPPQST